ncbi:hypothetical protein KEHDKFFH_08390 [Marinobacter maroccanus]|uniref:O-antigen ligase-related domain-containing protein n=1 Tax=Marinobacter maroccanus TaxID=2055143 RepID=A0A2S5ZBJ5_9GAMM|nr:O-antigen ligase family protein [Marinobacter maroccanus]PPI84711.1 hypothetical protein KEHDKFFH_08390 [Marinobacter maroccanus]
MQGDVVIIKNKRKQLNSSRTSSGKIWLYILISYYGFEYVRFQESFLPFLSPLKIPMLLNLLLALYVLANFKRLRFDKFVISVLVIWVLILAWVPFATNTFHAFQTAKSMSMVFFTCFATVLIVDTEEKFLKLLNWLIIFFVLVSFWIIRSGGTGPGGFVGDENDAALLMVCALPVIFYSIFHSKNKKLHYFLFLGLFSVITAIVLTYSRGGFVGLVAVIWFMIWMSKKRWKVIFISTTLFIFSGGIALSFLPKAYVDDMSTITNKEDETRNLRLLHWTTAIEIFKDKPIFGVGPGNYPWTSNRYLHLSPYFKEGARFRAGRQSHSLYFTLIPELGAVGVIAFIVLVFKFRANMITIIRRSSDESMVSTAKSLYSMLIGFLVTGAFISVLYYPVFWHIIFLGLAFCYIRNNHELFFNINRFRNGEKSGKADSDYLAGSKI